MVRGHRVRGALLLLGVPMLFMVATPAPAYAQESIWLGSLRTAFGGAAYLSPVGGGGVEFDLTAGVHVATNLDRSVLVRPLIELGYSRHGGDVSQGCGNYFVVGAGLSLGKIPFALSLVSSYLVGTSMGDSVQGFRTALRADFYLGVWSLEVGHEWRFVRDVDVHAIRAMIAIDLGTAISWATRLMSANNVPGVVDTSEK